MWPFGQIAAVAPFRWYRLLQLTPARRANHEHLPSRQGSDPPALTVRDSNAAKAVSSQGQINDPVVNGARIESETDALKPVAHWVLLSDAACRNRLTMVWEIRGPVS
jgi:hypothetical protein